MDFDFDLNVNIDLNLDLEFDTKHIEPVIEPEIKEEYLEYKKAQDLANDIDIKKGSRHYCFVNGSFCFGDFIEALIVEKQYIVKNLTISSLSLNENNIDSFANFMDAGYVDNFNLIISTFFWGHERHKNGLMPYIYEKLEKDNKFQLSVYRTHCKIIMIELYNGFKIVIHGSANLRSSGNIEQIMIEENESLYDFNFKYHEKIIDKYKTIRKE